MTIDMTPPPAVVEFAEKNECKNIQVSPFWNEENLYNGYVVYFVDYIDTNKGEDIILFNKDEVRFSTADEFEEIIKVIF